MKGMLFSSRKYLPCIYTSPIREMKFSRIEEHVMRIYMYRKKKSNLNILSSTWIDGL